MEPVPQSLQVTTLSVCAVAPEVPRARALHQEKTPSEKPVYHNQKVAATRDH